MEKEDKVMNITEADIQKGIDEGRYRSEGTLVRDVSNGQVVKIIPKSENSSNGIPSTFIQVNNTVIYQTDISLILKNITKYREVEIFDELEEKYNLVLDYLDSYCTYNTKLEKLNENCLESSISFDNHIRKFIQKINIKDIETENFSLFTGALDAYVKVIFVYIISTYLLHRKEFKSDKVIIGKILNFEDKIKQLYQQILAESSKNNKGIEMFDMQNTLYSMYLFNNDYNIDELDRVVHHDSRFDSALQVIGFFKEHLKNGYFQRNHNNYYSGNQNTSISISVSTFEIPVNSKRNLLANKLLSILEDIDKLKNIREEILELESIDDKNIINYFELNIKSNQS